MNEREYVLSGVAKIREQEARIRELEEQLRQKESQHLDENIAWDAQLRELEAKVEKQERAVSEEINERDHWADLLQRIDIALGGDGEWSNNRCCGLEALEAAETQTARIRELERQCETMGKIIDEKLPTFTVHGGSVELAGTEAIGILNVYGGTVTIAGETEVTPGSAGENVKLRDLLKLEVEEEPLSEVFLRSFMQSKAAKVYEVMKQLVEVAEFWRGKDPTWHETLQRHGVDPSDTIKKARELLGDGE